jgi:hypothetical protein
MTATKPRLKSTLRPFPSRPRVREGMQTQASVKLDLVSHSRDEEQKFVKPENRIPSMKH